MINLLAYNKVEAKMGLVVGDALKSGLDLFLQVSYINMLLSRILNDFHACLFFIWGLWSLVYASIIF